MSELKHSNVLLKGKSFDVSYAQEGDLLVLYSVEKFGENFGDILAPEAIRIIREQLEFVDMCREKTIGD